MTDSIANGGCCSGSVRPGTYGDSADVAQITVDKCGRITKVSNVAITGPFANLVVSNSITTTNIFASGNVYIGGLLFANLSYLVNNSNYMRLLPDGSFTFPNNQIDVGSNSLTMKTQSAFTWDWNDGTGNLTEVNLGPGGVDFNVATPSLSSRWYFNTDGSASMPGNVYVANAVTTANVHVTNTLDVIGSMTANAANATFFFDTFTIPYINTQYLNVSSNVTLSGNLSAPLANITTLNVNYLTVNSAVVYGATTLNVYGTSNLTNVFARTANVGTINVWQISNLSTLAVTNNLYAANAVTTTNVFATRLYGDGGLLSNLIPSGTAGQVLYLSGPGRLAATSNIFQSTTSNNVGIGTTSPGYLLDVNGLVLNSSDPYGVTTARFKSSSGTLGSGILLDARNLTGGKACSIWTSGNNAGEGGGKLMLGHIFDAYTAPLIVDMNTLSVGVGTTTPGSNLEVTGNMYVSNTITTTNVVATSVIPTVPISFRNRVINGDFIIDQRNGGAATTPGAGTTRTIDKWKVEISGTGRCQVGQNLGAIVSPPGFTSYYGLKVTTTTSVSASDYLFFGQVIEGINTVDWQFGTSNAKPVTLSFWVYSSIAGTGGGFVRNAGTTAGNYSRSYPFTFTINSTNTWEYKTITIPGDTTGQWLAGQVDGIEFGIELWNGSTWQGTPNAWNASNKTGPSGGTINYAGTLNSYMYISGVQFEQGLIASPFERRPIDFELAQCQRYYEPSVARMGGYHTAGGYLRSSVYFNVKKRPAPSPTFTVISTPESVNFGALGFDNSNYDQSSARILASVTATGDAYGQWKVAVDADF